MATPRPFAVVTGASSGIGYELALECARAGFDLAVAADEPDLQRAAETFSQWGAHTIAVEADLASRAGVERLLAAIDRRPVDVLIANAGEGHGGAFLDCDFGTHSHIIETNVTGTLYLIHEIGRGMRDRRCGRMLIVGSIAGYMPGAYNAVYNATKAFIDSFAAALRSEVKDWGVSVTLLMPGATETRFFERAGMLDTKLGQGSKDDPADVARAGFDAMMRGEADVVFGWRNKLQTAIASVIPSGLLAELHRRQAEPRKGMRE